MRSFLVPFAALTALILFAGCGDSKEGGDVDVTLSEWSIVLDKETLPEGPIEFTIENKGEREHEFVIVRTSLAADELPAKDDGSVDEDGADVDVEREVEDIEDGDRTSRTFELDPGSYVFLCNIVEDIEGEETSHYEKGMRVGFTVTAEE